MSGLKVFKLLYFDSLWDMLPSESIGVLQISSQRVFSFSSLKPQLL